MSPLDRIHGGPDVLGVPRYDFSTNANACGPCHVVLEAVGAADPTVYPDASYADLKQKLAVFHGVDVRRILLAASASEFIFRITAWHAGQGAGPVGLPLHSYGDYAAAAAANRLPVVAGNAGGAGLRWACDPSSPVGAADEHLAALAPAPGRPVVLDRAYEPLRLNGELALSLQALQAYWQLWTPNKALGLTGIRAAYAIAPVDAGVDVDAVNQLCPSWPVGAHGVAMLQAWTQPTTQAWLQESLERLRQWKHRQLTICQAMSWDCLPSMANFFCARPALPQGLTLQQALAQLRTEGIKLRDTASFGLPGHVRLSVLSPRAQDALQAAWQHITGKATT